MKRLAIIGSEDLACQIAHLAADQHLYQISGFFDDFKPKGSCVSNIPILGGIEDVQQAFNDQLFDEIIIGIGYNHILFRNDLFERFQGDIPFGSVIHTSSYIDKTVTIGKGTVIFPGCTIDMQVEIGNNCLFYNGCNIAHDTSVSNNTIFSPGVNIAGFCKIGAHVLLGIGSVLSDNIVITEKVRTGAGTVVVNSIVDSGTYVGVPAKKIKS
jgi:sugar O-acyltransferase (sialic acid O-acetyltransferase NeuD family)